jgi:argininosuccinate lyase
MTKEHKKQFWGKRLDKSPAPENILFCAGRDVRSLPMADEVLVIYDLWTNYAHCEMLRKQKILSDSEWQILQDAFRMLLSDYKQGEFQLDAELEDVHTNIENYLVYNKKIIAAKKIHTARSRNDQVATSMRLYLRQHLLDFIHSLFLLAQKILAFCEREKNTAMIGFSHFQPAMPTTLAHWMAHWSQAISRSIFSMLQLAQQMNISPLGAVAGFGTTWNIDREYAAKLLGFDGVEQNSLDCISARGEWEARIASNIAFFMNQACMIAQDLIMLSHPYFGMMKIDDAFVTGSSIMPQKKNLDFAEVIRSKCSFCHGNLQSLLGLTKGVMSGYNRDSQQAKYLIMDLFSEVAQVPKILHDVIHNMQPCKEKMKQLSTQNYAISADLADYLSANSSLAFRDSYHLVSLAIKTSDKKIDFQSLQSSAKQLKLKFSFKEKELQPILNNNNPIDFISEKKHTGAPSPTSVAKNILYQRKTLDGWGVKLQTMLKNISESYLKCFPS